VIRKHGASAPESNRSTRFPLGAIGSFPIPRSLMCFEFRFGMAGTSPVKNLGDMWVTKK
jgi:hypothetical protein